MVAELQFGADDLAMGDGLVVHLDLPGSVISDDDQNRSFVTNCSVDFDRIEAEGAIAGCNDDSLFRKSETCRNSVGHADTDAAERARIEHRRSVESDTREAKKISAIGDDDCVIANRLLKRRQNFVRMKLSIG